VSRRGFRAFALVHVVGNGKKGTVPRVDKISTPGHNWVLVSYSNHDQQSTKARTS